MPVFVPAFFAERRRQGRRRGNLKGRSTDGSPENPLKMRRGGNRYYEAAAERVGGGATLFLLPGGLPRRFGVAAAIQLGGRPGPRTRTRARRSRLPIASSICSRSALSSARIFPTSTTIALPADFGSDSSQNRDCEGVMLPTPVYSQILTPIR